MGYPEVACEELQLNLDYFSFLPLSIHCKIIYGRYGNADINDVFYLEKREFPVNPVHNNLYVDLSARYRYHNSNIEFSYKYLEKSEHYLNRWKLLGKHNIMIEISKEINLRLFN